MRQLDKAMLAAAASIITVTASSAAFADSGKGTFRLPHAVIKDLTQFRAGSGQEAAASPDLHANQRSEGSSRQADARLQTGD